MTLTTLDFGDIYSVVESGGSAAGLPGGIYDVVVEDTRIKADKALIFLDLRVLNGPSQGKVIQVNLNLPKAGDKPGVAFYFAKKIAGFKGADLSAAFEAAKTSGTDEGGLSIIADALKDKQVTAKITLDEDDNSPYKGTNQLEETKALAGAPAPTPVEAAPVEAPASTPF